MWLLIISLAGIYLWLASSWGSKNLWLESNFGKSFTDINSDFLFYTLLIPVSLLIMILGPLPIIYFYIKKKLMKGK